MTDEGAEVLIRQAIGGDDDAMAWVRGQVDVTEDPMLLVMAALLACLPDGPTLLDRAAAAASYREDRQLVAIARAHLAGDRELVDALARDHLVDFPGSYVVAWVASGARSLAFQVHGAACPTSSAFGGGADLGKAVEQTMRVAETDDRDRAAGPTSSPPP